MSRIRTYRLFTPDPDSPHLTRRRSRWREGDEQRWRVLVRARSVRQAYYLAANHISWNGRPGTVGTVTIIPPEPPKWKLHGRPPPGPEGYDPKLDRPGPGFGARRDPEGTRP